MLLKRVYNKSDGWVKKVDNDGNCTNPPPLDHIVVRNTGTTPEQHFSRRIVEGAVAGGWMTLSRGKITLHAKPEDLSYTILRAPGHYCCHCGLKLESDSRGELARKHVAAEHPDAKSPDLNWSAGYSVTHAYECVLDAAQHKRFKSTPIGKRS